MKALKIFMAAAIAALAISCATQGPKADVDPTTVKNVKELLPSKAQTDSVSYLVGVWFGSMLKGNDFGEDLNYALIRKGLNDFLAAEGDPMDSNFVKQFRINPEEMNDLFNNFLGQRRTYKSEKNRRAGEEWLEANKGKDGVEVTESGLQYKIIEAGDEVRATDQDTVFVKYTGTLTDGTQFDSSNDEAVKFFLNRVVPGFGEGLKLIGQGGKIELYIPAELGYGSRGTRGIEPNSTLIFSAEITEIKPYVEPAPEPAKPAKKK